MKGALIWFLGMVLLPKSLSCEEEVQRLREAVRSDRDRPSEEISTAPDRSVRKIRAPTA